jgi:sugar O-acyltransferase (sialic acid O-acetyltransferase NeuD family)
MTKNKEKIVIFGASGHAKVVIDVLERQGVYEVVCLVDDDLELMGETFFGYDVIGGKAELLAMGERPSGVIVAIGSNLARTQVAQWLVGNEFELISSVHPSVQLGRGVCVGSGSIFMANAVANSATRIGNNVIINTSSSIDHDCIIEDGVHVAPGATLCGSVRVGARSFIGAGATVAPNLTIGENVTVGAGATVVQDVPDGVTVVGTPAKAMNPI